MTNMLNEILNNELTFRKIIEPVPYLSLARKCTNENRTPIPTLQPDFSAFRRINTHHFISMIEIPNHGRNFTFPIREDDFHGISRVKAK